MVTITTMTMVITFVARAYKFVHTLLFNCLELLFSITGLYNLYTNSVTHPLSLSIYVLLVSFPFFTSSCMRQRWTDPTLAWNKSEYGGLDKIRVLPDMIWRPDILVYNR